MRFVIDTASVRIICAVRIQSTSGRGYYGYGLSRIHIGKKGVHASRADCERGGWGMVYDLNHGSVIVRHITCTASGAGAGDNVSSEVVV